MGEKNECNVG